MKLLNRLERRLGRYAIQNLMKYIIIIYGVGLVLGSFIPHSYLLLRLDFNMVAKGQVWRLITSIIPLQSLSSGIFLTLISLYFYYIIGNALERSWGAFRFNLYFISGIIFNILAAWITYLITGYSIQPSLDFVCGTMFFAFAAMYPDMQFLMYFLIPIKAKYLAWFQGAIYLYNIFIYIVYKQYYLVIPLIVSFANFLIFYFATRNYRRISPGEFARKANFRRQMQGAGYQSNHRTSNGTSRSVITRHKCAVCGRTELDDDDLEFRFCSKCDGNYEYCMEHLFTHEHVKRQ